MKLKDLCEIVRSHPSRPKDQTSDSGYLYITPNMIGDKGELVIQSPRFLPTDSIKEEQSIQYGDILMVTMGPPERLAELHEYKLPIPALASQSVLILRPKSQDVYERLRAQRFILKTQGQGALHPRLSVSAIKDLEI